jgi:4-hydroxy-tetrahydrodipicolinate synthase
MRDLKGYFVPIFTPFNRDGSIDERAMRRNISYLIEEGIHAITMTGSFGEFPLLDSDERIRLYELAVDEAQGRCTVVAGTAHAQTRETVRLSQAAESAGVDGIMLIAPYYLLPSERDLREHFGAVARSVSLPVTIYNNPPRTGLNMRPAFLVELSRLDNVVTIKQSSDFFFDLLELIRLTQDQPGFHVTNGQEMWAFPALLMGAEACYGVSPLLLGRQCIEMYDCASRGDMEQGRKVQLRINIIRAAIRRCRATPAACLREMANARGLAAGHPRAPIAELSGEDKAILRDAYRQAGLESVRHSVPGAS